MSWADLGDDADRDYTIAKPPQKGEKMPTFEPTVKEIIAEMYKRFGHLLGAREIDEFAHDFGRSPAASGERGLTFGEWFTTRWPRGNAMMDSLLEAWNAALQSVPSSPLCIGYPDCDGDLPREEHSEKCKAAEPSDAGQPALEKLRELEAKWEELGEHPSSCRSCSFEQSAYRACSYELHAVLAELEPKASQPRTCELK